MAEQDLNIKVKASDEASGVFQKIKESARQMQLEERNSGGRALETMLKGGGALGLASLAVEGVHHMSEEFSAMAEAARTGEASVSAVGLKALESVPLVGGLVGTFHELAKAIFDVDAGERIEKVYHDVQKLSAEMKETSKLKYSVGDEHAIAQVDSGYTKQRAEAIKQLNEAVTAQNSLGIYASDASKDDARMALAAAQKNYATVMEEHQRDLDKITSDGEMRRARIVVEGEAKLHAAEGAAAVEELALAGNATAAKLAALQNAYQQAVTAIDQKSTDAKKLHPEDAAAIDNAGGSEKQAALVKLNSDTAKVRADAAAETARTVADAGRDISDAEHRATQAQLKSSHEDGKAIIDEIEFQHRQRIDKIAATKTEGMGAAGPAMVGAMMASEGDLYAAQMKEGNEQVKHLDDERIAHRAVVDETMHGMAIKAAEDDAKSLSGAAGLQAKAEAEKLKIMEDYAKRREELRRIEHDDMASADEKAQAEKMDAALDAQQAKALARVGQPDGSSVPGIARTEASIYSSGIVAAAAEGDTPATRLAAQQVAAQEKANEIAQAGNDLLQQLLDTFQGLGVYAGT